MVDKTTQGAMDTVKVDDMTADERANQIIDDALAQAAQEAVKQAKTKKASHCGPGPDLCYGKEASCPGYEDQCRQAVNNVPM